MGAPEPAAVTAPAEPAAPGAPQRLRHLPAPVRRARGSSSASSKTGTASFISHLDLMSVFERALVRAGVRARFTEGFNPKPRLEFASPLGLGIDSEDEIAAVVLEDVEDAGGFAERMNRALPPGLRVTRADLTVEDPRARRRSLMSLQWGSEYRVDDRTLLLQMGGGRTIRKELEQMSEAPRGPVRRMRTLATGEGGAPASYFDVLCAAGGPAASPGTAAARSSALS